MNSYLIYHPRRCLSKVGIYNVYHDKFGGNEDPYIWNEKFLHSFCHIPQITKEIGQINFWVSGDTYPNFSQLFCDCVFVVKEKIIWQRINSINRNDPVVDNSQTYKHHYKWVHQHPFKKKKRYTLKADPHSSYQPQTINQVLLDIIPFLNSNGISTKNLIQQITSQGGSRPFKMIQSFGEKLYDYINANAGIKIYGISLQHLHP